MVLVMKKTISCLFGACFLLVAGAASADEADEAVDERDREAATWLEPGASHLTLDDLDIELGLAPVGTGLRVAEQPGGERRRGWERSRRQRQPPRPRLGGVGAIITGWIMFGGGAAVSGLSLLILSFDTVDDPGFDDDSESILRFYALGGGLVAAVGIGLAIYGHGRLSETRRQRRAWDRRYGSLDRQRPMIVPVAYKHGGGGAMIVGSF